VRNRVLLGAAVAAIAIGGLFLMRAPTTRPDWARCAGNHVLACTSVDGVALGEFVRSWPVDAAPCLADCETPVETARAELEVRRPGHSPPRAIEEFGPDRYALCGKTLCAYSGYLGVFVFAFNDADPESIVVSCPGVMACRIIDEYGATG
jgi:hypothetical protein